MVRVTEIPQRDLTSQIRSIAWDEDGTLYIKGERCNPCDTFYVAATSERAHVVDRLPDSVAGVFQSEAGPHFVTTENEGHGDIRLRVRTGNETIEIARGNWELESFILDTRRDRLLYPVAEFPPRIAVFDLKTRQNREVFMPGGRRGIADIHLLDQSRDGARVAYSAYGSCLPDESLKDDVYLRISPSPQSTLPRALCLVELHGAQ